MSWLTPYFQSKLPNLYRWLTLRMVRTHFDHSPFTPLRKPLSQCRIALVSTGGFHLDTQPRFRTKRWDECSYREIPADAPIERIQISHDHYDHAAASSDINVLLPRDRMRELAAEGVIGSLAPVMISFMGAILHPKELVRRSAPEAARRLKQWDVDVALLSPA